MRLSDLTRLAQQPVAQVLELVERRVADPELALLSFPLLDLDAQPEGLGKLCLRRARVGVRGLAARSGPRTFFLRERLDVAHGQAFVNDAKRKRLGVGAADERPRVASAQLARAHHLLHAVWQL